LVLACRVRAVFIFIFIFLGERKFAILLHSTKQNEVASVGGTFVTIDDVAGAERSGGFAVTVVAVVDIANDADDLAGNADDVLGGSFIFGGLV